MEIDFRPDVVLRQIFLDCGGRWIDRQLLEFCSSFLSNGEKLMVVPLAELVVGWSSPFMALT